MLPVSGAAQLNAIAGDGRAAAHLLAEQPVLPVREARAVALVGHEEVPEPLRAGALADVNEDLRVGDAGLYLVVEGAQRLHLDRIDVLVEEGADPLAQLLDPRAGLKVHAGILCRGSGGGRRRAAQSPL